jgi:hypothetical protein
MNSTGKDLSVWFDLRIVQGPQGKSVFLFSVFLFLLARLKAESLEINISC